MIVAVIITGFMIFTRNDFGSSLVVFWACIGIWVNRTQVDMQFDRGVEVMGIIGLSIIAVLIILKIILNKNNRTAK